MRIYKLITEATQYFTDDIGNPLLVFHGTDNEFNEFHSGKGSGSMGESVGYYFTDSKDAAMYYSNTGKVISAYLKLNNPLIIPARMIDRSEMSQIVGVDLESVYAVPDRAEVYWFLKNGDAYDGRNTNVGTIVSTAIRNKGHDGVIFKERINGRLVTVYTVFDSNQITIVS